MNSLEYKTIKKQGCAEYEDRKSRFIANVFPVETEEKALEYLNAVKKKYSDARHNVYAYVVRENNVQRYSDDGEPSGTAGMPVLDAIRKRGLTDMLVVVTRYFGGTLLGTGGLVHAYGKSASDGIENAEPVTKKLCSIFMVKADYGLSGKIEYSLKESEYILEDIAYTDEVIFTVGVPAGVEEKFIKEITELSLGSITPEKTGEKFVDTEKD